MKHTDLAPEYSGANLKDARLSKRLTVLADRLATKPAASFPKALNSAELEGAYRFFGNSNVKPPSVLEPHFEQTLKRLVPESVVLAVHDTTTLSFRSEGQREGFGSISGKSQQLWTHATLAVGADGSRAPLGVLALTTEATIRHDRWMDQVDEANRRVGSNDRLVHVMDREADDFAFYAHLVEAGARFVIRMQFNRRVASDDDKTPTVSDALAHATLTAEREVSLSRRSTNAGSKTKRVHPARRSRKATLSMAAASMTLRKPVSRKELPDTLEVSAIRVWEESPPAGEPDVEWLLVTTERIETPEDLLRVVDWYRARWLVEEFFKAMKTGCSIEKRQLESFHSFTNAVAFFAPMAWQMLLLRHRAHQEEGDGEASLPPGMLNVLRHIARKPLPPKPTAREVLLAVAALGGHLKNNGPPGWQTLGYGYEKLREAAVVWDLAILAARSDQS